MKSNIIFDFWACARPMTKKWGSGQVFDRVIKKFGKPDVAFGKTDGIPNEVYAIDEAINYKWGEMPYGENAFEFGYWDPPYDKLYKKEATVIWKTCKKLAILHTHVYPKAWFKNAERVAMVAVTMGPLKQIRILQIFKKPTEKQGDLCEIP